MKRTGRILRFILIGIGCIAVVLLIVAGVILGPYLMRVQHFPADPAAGYHANFYLYVSPAARRAASNGNVTLLVQPNNSGTNSDDPAMHSRDAWWTGFERSGMSDELGVVLLVPAFIRPGEDWRIYTHALDRDALTTRRPDITRIDLQLLAMVRQASAALAGGGLRVDEKFLIQGYSASGMFANRFTALHPNWVKAAAIGSPGGWPIAPVADFAGETLPYPAGVADIEALTGHPFDSQAFKSVPQLFVLGSLDDNDSLDFRDGWEEEPALLVDRLFGAGPLARWKPAEDLYRSAGVNARFVLVEGVGHDRRKLQSHTTEFFKKVLEGKP
jgi:pimeloyl-ACP methyl ester carboxylesterase